MIFCCINERILDEVGAVVAELEVKAGSLTGFFEELPQVGEPGSIHLDGFNDLHVYPTLFYVLRPAAVFADLSATEEYLPLLAGPGSPSGVGNSG